MKEPGTYIAFCFPNTMTLVCLSNALAVKIHVQISCFCFLILVLPEYCLWSLTRAVHGEGMGRGALPKTKGWALSGD